MLAGGLEPAEVEAAVRRTGADVVHAHNIHPLWGVTRPRCRGRAGAAVVMHLHNYRLFCAIAIGYRDGAVCTRCRGRNMLPGRAAALPRQPAGGGRLRRRPLAQQPRIVAAVDRFVAPSAFAADRLAELGLRTRGHLGRAQLPPAGEFAAAPPDDPPAYALFAGRLVEEKGVDTAVEAAALADVPLVVAGDGPEAEFAAWGWRGAGARTVQFLGQLDPAEMRATLARAAFVVAPSRWDEPCPYSVIEAMAAGVPVLASDAAGCPSWWARACAAGPRRGEWAAAMRALWNDAQQRRARGVEALARARRLFGAERFYTALMDVYAAAGAR